MKISIIGTGFVGLITGTCLSKKFDITCVDIDEKKVRMLNEGKAHFFEEGMEPLLKESVTSGRLRATTDLKGAIQSTDVTFVSVGTPMKDDGSQDSRFIESAAEGIGDALKEKDGYHLVVVRSTVVPGTTRKIVGRKIEEKSAKKAGTDFGLCMQPEFLREGNAVEDTLNPDRIVIGSVDKRSGDVLQDIYTEFYGSELPILRMGIESAELVKYANNSFLATKISFINEIANICQLLEGVDVKDIAKGIGLDKRINPRFLQAGPGFGGSCFPKDVSAIVHFGRDNSYEPILLESVLEVNKRQALRMIDLAEKEAGDLKGKRVSLLGLSFKPGTDDMREAPSLKIIDLLLKKGARVIAYDPVSKESAQKMIGDSITYASSVPECLKDSDVCLLVTDWPQFTSLKDKDFSVMKTAILIDGRRAIEPSQLSETRYVGIGLG